MGPVKEENMTNVTKLGFPAGFTWGAATAAYQIVDTHRGREVRVSTTGGQQNLTIESQ